MYDLGYELQVGIHFVRARSEIENVLHSKPVDDLILEHEFQIQHVSNLSIRLYQAISR